jgi:hypothetical protein
MSNFGYRHHRRTATVTQLPVQSTQSGTYSQWAILGTPSQANDTINVSAYGVSKASRHLAQYHAHGRRSKHSDAAVHTAPPV